MPTTFQVNDFSRSCFTIYSLRGGPASGRTKLYHSYVQGNCAQQGQLHVRVVPVIVVPQDILRCKLSCIFVTIVSTFKSISCNTGVTIFLDFALTTKCFFKGAFSSIKVLRTGSTVITYFIGWVDKGSLRLGVVFVFISGGIHGTRNGNFTTYFLSNRSTTHQNRRPLYTSCPTQQCHINRRTTNFHNSRHYKHHSRGHQDTRGPRFHYCARQGLISTQLSSVTNWSKGQLHQEHNCPPSTNKRCQPQDRLSHRALYHNNKVLRSHKHQSCKRCRFRQRILTPFHSNSLHNKRASTRYINCCQANSPYNTSKQWDVCRKNRDRPPTRYNRSNRLYVQKQCFCSQRSRLFLRSHHRQERIHYRQAIRHRRLLQILRQDSNHVTNK